MKEVQVVQEKEFKLHSDGSVSYAAKKVQVTQCKKCNLHSETRASNTVKGVLSCEMK